MAFWSAVAAAAAFVCSSNVSGIQKRQLRLPHSKRSSPSRRVGAQHLHHLGYMPEVVQSAGDVRVGIAADDVDVEGVLPGAAFDGARFDFGEVEVEHGEGAEGSVEGA